jgi:hypothetical protein
MLTLLQEHHAADANQATTESKKARTSLTQGNNTFLDCLCHRIVSGDSYSSRQTDSRNSCKKELASDIRSLMGLLAGYLLMTLLPQHKCPQVGRLLIGEVQCIVREVLVASSQDDALLSSHRLLRWARSKQW